MNSREIQTRARECRADLDALVAVQSTSDEHQTADDIDWEDQRGRFLIWCANIGAFADGHASLDHRLRESPEARKLMLDLLSSLRNCVRRAMNVVKPDNTQSNLLALTSEEGSSIGSFDQFSATSSMPSSYYGSEISDSTSGSVYHEYTPFEQRLRGIEQSIDRLYRLTVAIRKPSPINQHAKITNFVIRDDEDNDIGETFHRFALTYVSHNFPEAAISLRERLAAAITLRRKRFLYRQSHQKKLSKNSYSPAPTLLVNSTSRVILAESTVLARTIVESPVQDIPKTAGEVVKAVSQTSASKISEKFRSKDIFELQTPRPHTSFSSNILPMTPYEVPPPPTLSPGSKEFECPYCCMMLPVTEAVLLNWTRHVLNDIEPYLCVFENCQDSHRFFPSRAGWISHMKENHTKQWTCTAAGHRNQIFADQQDFETHMREDHADNFKESLLDWYVKRSQGSSSSIFSSCPLCGYVPAAAKIDSLMRAKGLATSDKHERERLISEDVVKELAIHLQMLSIKALPWHEDVQEGALSEKQKSDHLYEVLETTKDSSLLSLSRTDDSPLLFDDSGFRKDNESETESLLSTNSKTSSQESDMYDVNEWAFIPRRADYGPNRDPVLQKMLKKRYLDSSSAIERRARPVLPIYMMPPTPLNKNFFGRDHALDTIMSELCPRSDALDNLANGKAPAYPLAFAICGPGGMGKTQLAIQFALSHRRDFDAIFWVNTDSANEIAQGFRRIALLLDLVAEDSPDANDLTYTREIVKRWLVNPRARDNDDERKSRKSISWLLIYDGVQDPDVLNDYWPYDGPGSILITSRNPFSWAKSLPLKPFTSAEAIHFMLKLTGRDISEVDQDSLTTISSRLGGLPLALTQMTSIIVTKRLTFRQFLESYNERESQLELLQFQTELRSQSYEHTVASVWAFENLKHGKKLLNVLSMIDPDGIPEKILTENLEGVDLPGYPKTMEEYYTARRELLACSLVTTNKQEKKLFIHRLVQDVTRARMGHLEFRQTLVTCVKLVAFIWPFKELAWRHGIARWPECQLLFPHIARLKDLYHAVLPSSAESVNDYLFARLLTDVGWYLHERGRPVESNLFNNMAQSICESLNHRLYEQSCPDSGPLITHAQIDYTLAELFHNRGCIASDANDAVEAMKNLTQFHTMMFKELGDVSQSTDMRLGLACNELGNAYMLKEDWVEGEKYFQQSIDSLSRLENYEPVSLSLPTVNLGYSFWLQGRLGEAMVVLHKGISDREAEYGENDRISFISGRFYHALGNVMYDQGLVNESNEYHHKALSHYKDTLGSNHHRTAAVFVKIAEHNIRNHQNDTAIALLEHALKVYSNSGNYVPEKARASFKLSHALRSVGRTHEADKQVHKCFKVYKEVIVEKNLLTKQQRIPKRRVEDLVDQDFDDLVAFWSK